MNRVFSSNEQNFISLVVSNGSGKLQFIPIRLFQNKFDKIFYFYQHYQPLYGKMRRKITQFIQGVDFELIENLPNNGTKQLLIFEDSCEEKSNSKQFFKNCYLLVGDTKD